MSSSCDRAVFIFGGILFILILIPPSACQCWGIPSDEKDSVECRLESSSQNSRIDCGSWFYAGNRVLFRCKENFKAVGIPASDRWQSTVCKDNSNWSGLYNFRGFKCVIDYGKFTPPFEGVPLILNGQQVRPVDFPWHAALFYREFENGAWKTNYKCGGTLLDERFILTAAHCTYLEKNNEPRNAGRMTVILAPVSGKFEDNVGSRIQILGVAQIIRNVEEPYVGDSDGYKNDIAMLRLNQPAKINEYVRPVRLPSDYETEFRNIVMQVNGFGTQGLNENGKVQPAKSFYGINVTINSPECQKSFDSSSSTDAIYYPPYQFCTAPANPNGGICVGDSGGGAFLRDNDDHWSIQGMVSFGPRYSQLAEGCFNIVIFTRVQHYLSWIRRIMSSNGILPPPNPVRPDPPPAPPRAVDPPPAPPRQVTPKPVIYRPVTPEPVVYRPVTPEPVIYRPVNPPYQPTRPANPVPQPVRPVNPPYQPTRPVNPNPQPIPIAPPQPVSNALPSCSGTLYAVNSVAINLHNNYRGRHGVPWLQFDCNAAQQAQSYAQFLVAGGYRLQPKGGAGFGQNLWELMGASISQEEAVRRAINYWYEGVSEYFWGNPFQSSYRGQTFSQLVWKSTTQLGVGVASKGNWIVVVAFYYPPGNVVSRDSYLQNVFRPR